MFSIEEKGEGVGRRSTSAIHTFEIRAIDDMHNICLAYKLDLPASSQIHPIFHVSCLKKVIGDKIPVQTIFPELDEEGKIILETKSITDTRIRQLRNRSISKYLIKWRKLPAEDSTWEDESFIQMHPELLKRCEIHLSQGEGVLSPNIDSLPLKWGILH
jgi:hypothetical protein